MSEGGVPEALIVRSPRWLGVALVLNALLQAIGPDLFGGAVGRFLWVALWLAIAWVTISWRARISPNGIVYTNPGGKDWSWPWSQLQQVRVALPASLRPLVAARGPDGRRIRVNNGVVRTDDGQKLSRLAVQRLVETWAAAHAAPSDEGGVATET